ncbi:MAG: Sister chromatid cohesion protein 2 [Bogoriella megaspora]|nr:MAG: Sister chromatid cohesion protein 2 [Bogoriella megaspora]
MTTLLNHLRDDSASLKNRSLKSVTQLLESNPSILDRKDIPILSAFFTCLADNSSQVRDSALTLIGKCLSLRPSMDRSVYNRLVGRCNDTAATVRKRCIKLLKDLYLRNDEEDLRSTIAEAFLQRMTDPDEGVSELARQTFEEIWFTPYHGLRSGTELSAQNKIAFSKHVALIVKTEQRAAAASLEPLLKNVLKKDAKNASSNSNVCKEMVAIMVDAFIDDRAESERPFPVEYLETLAVFAKVGPKLFSAPQLELLRPYVQDITSNDSKRLFRAVLVIYRWVFPYLANMHPDFLKAVFESLLKNVAKLTKVELNEAALCLWTIDSAMKEGSRETIRLSRLMSSTLKGLYDMRQQQIVEDEQSPLYRKARKLLEITGAFGRVCDFDREKSPFKERFAQWNGESVVKLTIDVLHPFLTPQQGSTIRNLALETLCSICKSWPPQYRRGDVMSAIEEVFKGDEPMLKHTVLCGIREFFADEERRSETGAEIAVGEGIVNGSERLGKSLHASENDGVATSLAQYFLQFILKIAKSSQDQIALTATQVVASINRQGLVHPKETGITLVALETSPNNDIATIAYQEHKNLNQKHESVFDKEYMKAVQQSFEYQRYIVKDTRGVIHSPPVSKLRLTFEVLKIGAGKARKKFLANMCSRLDFDLVKLEASHETPIHLMFTRYCVENLALFEYARVDEILHLADCMEKLVATTGSGIAHAIETEAQKVQLELQPVATGDFPHIDAPYSNEITIDNFSIDEQRLRKLTVASMILSLIWETRTFLRRLWSLQRPRDGGKAKIAIKDLNRPPTKAQGVTPDRYFITINEIMSSLSSRAAQLARCRAFAELLAIDNEHKVASDDEDADLAKAAAGYETPSEDEGDGGNGPPSSKRGRKRKWSAGPAEMPTPSKPKKRGRPSLGSKRKSVDGAGDEE